MDLVGFLEGIKYHDIAKPFLLKSKLHSLLGFVLFKSKNKNSEALVCLCHHKNCCNDLLQIYFNLSGSMNRLPAYLLLSNCIDRLAASTYAFLEREYQNLTEYGYSIQNPFSRLPIRIMDLDTKGEKIADLYSKCSSKLWENANLHRICQLNEIKDKLNNIIQNQNYNELQELINNFQTSEKLINFENLLENENAPYRIFPERTYPPVNDTPLYEHGRLSKFLALAIYFNLKNKSDSFLQLNIIFDNIDNNIYSGKRGQKLSQSVYKCVEKKVIRNHQMFLLRISFSSIQNFFKNAFRLDDYHGIKIFFNNPDGNRGYLYIFKTNFHQKIAEALGDPSLSNCIEPLNQFSFDLIYLLPQSIGRKKIKNIIEEAFNITVKILSEELIQTIRNDFEHNQGISDIFKGKNHVLEKQLSYYFPRFKIIDVSLNNLPNNFNDFKKAFSILLFKCYRKLWKNIPIPPIYLSELFYEVQEGEICDVCGRNVIFKEFFDFYEFKADEIEKKLMEKVLYSFRKEIDKICLLCLGFRILSHGFLEEKWLSNMVHIDNSDGKVSIMPLEIDMPPKIIKHSQLEMSDYNIKNGAYVNLDACFVRWRNNKKEVFPSITAVADRDSNVALLWLIPNFDSGIFGKYQPLKKMGGLIRDLIETLSSKEFKDAYNKSISKLRGQIPKKLGKKNEDINDYLKSLDEFRKDETVKKIANQIVNSSKLIPKDILESHDYWCILKKFKNFVLKNNILQNLKNSNDINILISNNNSNLGLLTDNEKRNNFLTHIENKIREINCDFKNFYDYYYKICYSYKDKSKDSVFHNMTNIKPHMARVLNRITWIDRFFSNLSDKLINNKIRVLRLDTKFPNFIIAFPANKLTGALEIILKDILENLFSTNICNQFNEESNIKSLKLLELVISSILIGGIAIFKDKQPLYNVLSNLFSLIKNISDYNKKDNSTGINFGFIDLRGGLSTMIMNPKIQSDLISLYYSLIISKMVDRKSIISSKTIAESMKISQLQNILLYIRGKKKKWNDESLKKIQNRDIFSLILFYKKIIKE
ncbi:MAG: hypothetical protein ACTSVV_09830 [Promethearchaeota archaeon]